MNMLCSGQEKPIFLQPSKAFCLRNFIMSNINILLRHNYVSMPRDSHGLATQEEFATVMMNLSYYGYSLDADAAQVFINLGSEALTKWWKALEPELKNVTGDDRNMGDFVVYKNFPSECFNKSEAKYWYAQTLMYWGVPTSFFTEEVEPREGMDEQPQLKVLRKASPSTLPNILKSYVKATARWKEQEFKDVCYLAELTSVDFSSFGFKENLVKLAKTFIDKGRKVSLNTATDVLRLAAGLSDGDVSLRDKVRFAKFNRKTRRFFLDILESCSDLEGDMARRPEVWKRFIRNLHPGDYKSKFPKVCEAVDKLYNGRLTTFNSLIEGGLEAKDEETLELLSYRPGEFRRRLVHCLDVFGQKAANAFIADGVLNKLTVHQLVSVRRLLETANSRTSRLFPPRGNWSKVQTGQPRHVDGTFVSLISDAIGVELSKRVPNVKLLDDFTESIKLPTNDGEVSPYNRGTVFPIPDDVKFIRTASYWEAGRRATVWFDNGVNFFGPNWESFGTLCWDHTHGVNGATFSGDPVTGYEGSGRGRGCQMIDLDVEKLRVSGIRYCVWNILCYSRISFNEATEVYAALQWGKESETGKLFEPSRAQLSFPITGDSHTKYICYIDLESMEMVYLDANLPGKVRSASLNQDALSRQMPAFVEHLYSLPSVHDLFRDSVDESKDGDYIVYSDKGIDLKDVSAYVFSPENESNSYKDVDINALLSA
jgi:hypothetical protein